MQYLVLLIIFILAIGFYINNNEPVVVFEEKIVEKVQEKVVEKIVEKVVEVEKNLTGESVLSDSYWVYPDLSSPAFSWFFNSDGTFELASGKKTIKNKVGRWVDRGGSKVKLLYNNGDEKTLELISESKFALGSKVYKRIR